MEIVQSCIPFVFAMLQACCVMCIIFMHCVFFSGKHTDPLLDESLNMTSLFGDTFDGTFYY
jgi:hypothetical protein